jgi:hypothetical protein
MKKLFLSAMMCLMALSMNAQKCAVLEFRGSASVSVADVDGISEMFMTYFRPSGYTMIERAQIDKVISEQHFQRTNITDNQAVQLGKILNASVVILGKVSMLGGQYQVDVRAVNVQSGHDIAFEGATFGGDYRTNVKSIATKLAGKIAITPGSTVQSNSNQSTSPQPRKRNGVEVIYGYLKVFPNELGTFESEPTTVIAQINKQAQHGYNNWRIPTNEELSLLRANNYLGDGQYMTKEHPNGIVLLVTDGDDYAKIQKAEEEARKAKEEARQAKEARKASLIAEGYVDLGLPSGTMWKKQNEEGGFYTYDEAIYKFKNDLPTNGQYEELRNKCTWTWMGNGYKVVGSNGNSIFLPAEGWRNCNGRAFVGSNGSYWSSTPSSLTSAWYLISYLDSASSVVRISSDNRCNGFSVRLVKMP